MKHKFSFLILPMFLGANIVVAQEPSGSVFDDGVFSANTRLFYMNRGFDNGNPDAEALTAGGIFKYETGDYHGLKLGVGYYGSHRVGGAFERIDGIGTANLDAHGDDLSFVGELYLQYSAPQETLLKIGRQRLATPLMNDHDLRLLPSAYEAAIVRNSAISNTTIEAGYVKSYTGFTSKMNRFDDFDTVWGKDGLAYIWVTNSSVANLALSGQYIKALSKHDDLGSVVKVSDYRYIDAKYTLPYGTNSYLAMQYGGNGYVASDDSHMWGAKVGTTLWGNRADVALLYNQISDNAFKAVESGPMYSDWQQGYGPYEPSKAAGVQLTVRPMENLSIKLGYVDVSADKNFRSDGTYTDDFTETNIDAQYALRKDISLRARYSLKNQSATSDREDRDDLRLIVYYNF